MAHNQTYTNPLTLSKQAILPLTCWACPACPPEQPPPPSPSPRQSCCPTKKVILWIPFLRSIKNNSKTGSCIVKQGPIHPFTNRNRSSSPQLQKFLVSYPCLPQEDSSWPRDTRPPIHLPLVGNPSSRRFFLASGNSFKALDPPTLRRSRFSRRFFLVLTIIPYPPFGYTLPLSRGVLTSVTLVNL